MRTLALATLVALIAPPARAQDTDLELVLLADASGSITASELAFQRDSYALAMTDPTVLSAIADTAYGSIAVTYVEWAANQNVVVPWMRIADAEEARSFAAALAGAPRLATGRNAIGAALLAGRDLIEQNRIDGWRRVVDFSGDSANNYNGPPIESSRQAVLDAGITINGLAIRSEAGGTGLAQVYADTIIGGPGAFVVEARTREDLVDAIRRKLGLEISGIPTQRIVADAASR